MPEFAELQKGIFEISNPADFNEIAIKIFHYQAMNNEIYGAYIDNLGITLDQVNDYHEIPFLPIDLFKNHKVVTGNFDPEVIFSSSGTTGILTSKHIVRSVELYKQSFTQSFKRFFGDVSNYIVIALLPTYLERDGSSLVFMADSLIMQSNNESSGFYLNEYKEVSLLLKKLAKGEKKVLLLGVTYALLDLAEQFPVDFPELIIMETGGMKGKRKEMIREDLHNKLSSAFRTNTIYSEYGMTELLSQAYSKGLGKFKCPPWMNVIIRDVNDPFSILAEGKTGGLNIIDLANIHSCAFIETKDLGRVEGDYFEILGRFDNSDIRGCNLLVV